MIEFIDNETTSEDMEKCVEALHNMLIDRMYMNMWNIYTICETCGDHIEGCTCYRSRILKDLEEKYGKTNRW